MRATIRKRGEVWYLDQMVKGERYRESIGVGSKSWAQEKANALLVERINEGPIQKEARVGTLLMDLEGPWQRYANINKLSDAHRTKSWSCLKRILTVSTGKDYEKVLLSDLTRERVERYRENKILSADDEVDQDRKERSACSEWRQARAVIQSRALDFYRRRLELLVPESLDKVREYQLPRPPAWRYTPPPPDLVDATERAGQELTGNMRLIYRMGMNAGLRASEMVHIRGNWCEMHRGMKIIAIVTRPDFRPKGIDRRIPVPASLWDELAARGDDYVLDLNTKTKREDLIRYDFADWMRSIGWDRKIYPKAGHELRKLFGSRIFEELGPAAAQQYLGHASIETTMRYYAAFEAPLIALPER